MIVFNHFKANLEIKKFTNLRYGKVVLLSDCFTREHMNLE